MMGPPHIEARGLTKVFTSAQGPLTALEDVSLDVIKGSFVSIIGPSGGGKTTLLKIVGGLIQPTSGFVLMDTKPPIEAQKDKTIGFVFQDASLLPWRTVIENIRLPLQLNVDNTSENSEDPESMLEVVGLADFRDYYPHQLSGGMRQRVAFARALVFNPTVLLMDEPLGSLDEMTRTAMRYELLRLWESSPNTVLFVTHSIPEAVLLSDSLVVMSRQPGRVMREVQIDLPRPRDESIEQSGRFLEYTQYIRELLPLGASVTTPSVGARIGD